MKKQIFSLLLFSTSLFCMYKDKPKTAKLQKMLLNNIKDHNIVPLGLFTWPNYKENTDDRVDILKKRYKRFMVDIDKKDYGLVFNMVNTEYVAKKKRLKSDHPEDLFKARDENGLYINYWFDLVERIVERYAQTEVAKDQRFNFLNDSESDNDSESSEYEN